MYAVISDCHCHNLISISLTSKWDWLIIIILFFSFISSHLFSAVLCWDQIKSSDPRSNPKSQVSSPKSLSLPLSSVSVCGMIFILRKRKRARTYIIYGTMYSGTYLTVSNRITLHFLPSPEVSLCFRDK